MMIIIKIIIIISECKGAFEDENYHTCSFARSLPLGIESADCCESSVVCQVVEV